MKGRQETLAGGDALNGSVVPQDDGGRPDTLPADWLVWLREQLALRARPEAAAAMAAYMKGRFVFFGVQTPARRLIQRPVLAAGSGWRRDQILAFADACWAAEERELHYAAADLLRRYAHRLAPTDLDRVRALIVRRSWWDTVDTLAVHGVGALVRRHRALSAHMDGWIGDPDVWVARTAMLHQLQWRAETDPHRLFAYAERQAANPDFFMRKAIGWALRQYARTDPAAVQRFVTRHAAILSGLTRREALKHLS